MDQQNPINPKFKQQRRRRRLYESPIEDSAVTVPGVSDEQQAKRLARAEDILSYHVAQAGTFGMLPVPWLDVVVAGAVQLKLIRELCGLYGMPYSKQRAKVVLAALLGGLQTGLLVSQTVKYVPVVGFLLGTIPAMATSAGLTYAIGKVFIQHFELGGSLLDFDPAKMRRSMQNGSAMGAK